MQGVLRRLHTQAPSVPLPLSQSQVVDLLADLHDVPPEKRSALLSRLQHFSRLGFPSETNTGRGFRAAYGPRQIVELLLVFELQRLGTPSERAVEMVRGSRLENGYVIGLSGEKWSDAEDDTQCALVRPAGLAGYLKGSAGPHLTFSMRSLLLKLLRTPKHHRSFSIIDLTSLLREAATSLEESSILTGEEFDLALKRDADERMQALLDTRSGEE